MFELLELLTRVNACLLRALTPLVKEYRLSVGEMIILWKINRKGSCKITEFTTETGLPASTLTSLFDRMEKKELITRVPDGNDRRCILVQGTPKLTSLIEHLIEEADNKLTPIMDKLSPSFIEHLQQDLHTLQEQI